MSAQFTSLHPYVSQRLLSLFETLAKKHARLEAKIRTQPTVSADSTIVTVNGAVANTDLVIIRDVEISTLFTRRTISSCEIIPDPRLDHTGGGPTDGARNYKQLFDPQTRAQSQLNLHSSVQERRLSTVQDAFRFSRHSTKHWFCEFSGINANMNVSWLKRMRKIICR